MILRVEKEIGAYNGHACTDNEQDNENQQHETIDIVNLVRPKRGEDKVHFDKNGSKWENTTHSNDNHRFSIPHLVRDGAWNRIDPAWEISLATPVATNDSTKQCQWEAQEDPNCCHGQLH